MHWQTGRRGASKNDVRPNLFLVSQSICCRAREIHVRSRSTLIWLERRKNLDGRRGNIYLYCKHRLVYRWRNKVLAITPVCWREILIPRRTDIQMTGNFCLLWTKRFGKPNHSGDLLHKLSNLNLIYNRHNRILERDKILWWVEICSQRNN